jgi:hypothetical protein
MEPVYMNENRYSYLVSSYKAPSTGNYQAESPETAFEMAVHRLYLEGMDYLHNEEYLLALNAFRELMALILHVADPQMPVDPNLWPGLIFPKDSALLEVLIAKSAEILIEIPEPRWDFPPSVISERGVLPGPVLEELKDVMEAGLQITSHHSAIGERLDAALAAVEKSDWAVAARHYALALDKTPDNDFVLRASLLHDLAILHEKAGNQNEALERGNKAVELFERTRVFEARVQALDTMTGILSRAGKADDAKRMAEAADKIRNTVNISPVFAPAPSPVRMRLQPTAIDFQPPMGEVLAAEPRAAAAGVSTVDAPKLMAMEYVPKEEMVKSLAIHGTETSINIVLDNQAAAHLKAALEAISLTKDLGVVTGIFVDPIQFVAYLPHMYFFVIPMAIGDCLAGIGNLAEAAAEYQGVLPYPYINTHYEIVKLWTRLAQVYLDMGDLAFRRAKDNAAQYGMARSAYEKIVRADKTLDSNSPLYKDTKFAAIKTRVTNFLAAADPVAFDDNPAITTRVLDALVKLGQIESGLNFFGFGPDYVPPFSFEYLQNTARYFAKQASQIEQRYIQFKSQAESEELRREQLDQQAEVARQTVVLEQRGVSEAMAGVGVARANVDYAEVRRQNAVQAKADFQAVRWELLEYAELEAWAGAASVDQDDEVLLTTGAHRQYFHASRRRRSLVLRDLAGRRTRISHNLESAKLQRSINDATAYKAVAQAQLQQAQAREAVARQRVQIAWLQQRHAEENRDFLDMKEFGARLWYELAMVARRLKQRYLDMATEIAFLMERAYNAETERGLSAIRYDYSNSATNNLMGADMLLTDIDYFTYDHVTTVTTKKLPVKKVISLADNYPMAFHQLEQTGTCLFGTELADFERQYPGLYLCKLRNVELIIIGLSDPTSIAGTLRNGGVSRFRKSDGTDVARSYPADVTALSQYEIRQDALAFRFNPNDLRLFENSGIATLWQVDLPLDANDLDFRDILDIQLVLYFDGFYDTTLESNVRAALPNTGTASRGISLRMFYPDELYYLKHRGDAEVTFDAGMFPRNQKAFLRTDVTIKVLGKPGTVGHLTLRLTSDNHGAEIVTTTDSQGEINASTPGAPLDALKNEALLDGWTIQITADDNPILVEDGALDLSDLDDILLFFEYSFEYR